MSHPVPYEIVHFTEKKLIQDEEDRDISEDFKSRISSVLSECGYALIKLMNGKFVIRCIKKVSITRNTLELVYRICVDLDNMNLTPIVLLLLYELLCKNAQTDKKLRKLLQTSQYLEKFEELVYSYGYYSHNIKKSKGNMGFGDDEEAFITASKHGHLDKLQSLIRKELIFI